MNIPQSLIDFWQSSDRPCSLKNLEHQYIYINDTYREMLDLSKEFRLFSISCGSDSEHSVAL